MLRACNIFTSLHPPFSPPHHNFLAGNRLCSWLWKGRDFYSCISKMTVTILSQLWHVSAEMWALLAVLGSAGLADGSCVIRQETTRNGGAGGSGTGVVGLEVGPEAWSQDGKWITGQKNPLSPCQKLPRTTLELIGLYSPRQKSSEVSREKNLCCVGFPSTFLTNAR